MLKKRALYHKNHLAFTVYEVRKVHQAYVFVGLGSLHCCNFTLTNKYKAHDHCYRLNENFWLIDLSPFLISGQNAIRLIKRVNRITAITI